MFDHDHFKTLKNEDLVKRLNDLRVSLLPVSNEATLSLIEEIERRLGGGRPLTPLEQLPKKEQKLRESYEYAKSFRASYKGKFPFQGGIEPYEEWKIKYLEGEKASNREERARIKGINSRFQNCVESYFKREGDLEVLVDKDYKLTENAQRIVKQDISTLINNKKSRDLLISKLKIKNLKDPDEDDSIKFWIITRYDYEKTKKRKSDASKKK